MPRSNSFRRKKKQSEKRQQRRAALLLQEAARLLPAVRRDILLRVPVRQQRYQEEAVVLPSHPQDSVMSAILMYMEETA